MRNIVEEALNIGIQDNLVPLLPKVQYPIEGHVTISPREISPGGVEIRTNPHGIAVHRSATKDILSTSCAIRSRTTHWDAQGHMIRYRKNPNLAKPEPKIFVHYSPVIPLISGNPVTSTFAITMKQQPRFGAVGWISEAHPPSSPPGGCASLIHPTRATLPSFP